MSEDDLQALLETGIEAAQNGRPAAARALFDRVIARNPNHELAWLWKAAVAETPGERRACLRQVLVINPANLEAGRALEQLQRQTPPPAQRRAGLRMEDHERERLLASAEPAGVKRSFWPFALMAIALALMAAGAWLLIQSQRDTPAAGSSAPSAGDDPALTATLNALSAPIQAMTATPPVEIRTLPAHRDRLPATWTPTATWTPSPRLTATPHTPTPAGQTRRAPEDNPCVYCLSADL